MKRIITLTYILASITCLFCGCSEDVFMPNTLAEGEKVTTSLICQDNSPRSIDITRATEAEERRLDNLYIYIFDNEGQLIGYKGITTGLDQTPTVHTKPTSKASRHEPDKHTSMR